MSLILRFDSKNYLYAGPVLSVNDSGFIQLYKKNNLKNTAFDFHFSLYNKFSSFSSLKLLTLKQV